jgi:hypothetical protein
MNREAIFGALYDLVNTATSGAGIVTFTRKLKHWNDVAPSDLPALFLAQGAQTPKQRNGFPAVWELSAKLYVYVSTEGSLSPGTVINPIMDAICAALDVNAAGQPQQLGGLAQWARVDGNIETSEGTLGNLEVAIIPIRILTF